MTLAVSVSVATEIWSRPPALALLTMAKRSCGPAPVPGSITATSPPCFTFRAIAATILSDPADSPDRLFAFNP